MMSGMSTQIAIRLPDDLVTFLDERVTAGDATSRAAIVARVLERERYRQLAERDAQIYAEYGDDPEVAEFTTTAASETWGAE